MRTRYVIVRTLEEAAASLAADRLPIQQRHAFTRLPQPLKWLDWALGLHREEMLGMVLRRDCFSYTEQGEPHDLVHCVHIERGRDRVVAVMAQSAGYRQWQRETRERVWQAKWDMLTDYQFALGFDAIVAASSQQALDEVAVALTLALPA